MFNSTRRFKEENKEEEYGLKGKKKPEKQKRLIFYISSLLHAGLIVCKISVTQSAKAETDSEKQNKKTRQN